MNCSAYGAHVVGGEERKRGEEEKFATFNVAVGNNAKKLKLRARNSLSTCSTQLLGDFTTFNIHSRSFVFSLAGNKWVSVNFFAKQERMFEVVV
jgi:hypothetical protein